MSSTDTAVQSFEDFLRSAEPRLTLFLLCLGHKLDVMRRLRRFGTGGKTGSEFG